MHKPDSPEAWIEAMAEGASLIQHSASCDVQVLKSLYLIIDRCRRILDKAKEQPCSTTQDAFQLKISVERMEAEGELRVLEMLVRIAANTDIENQGSLSFVTCHKWAEAWHGFMARVLSKFKSF